jgi:ATP adenylyltransferase
MNPNELSALWAPWRVEYFSARKTPDFFLKAARAKNDATHLVLTRRTRSFLIMNRYPYTVGHMMAVPNRKVSDLAALRPDEKLELWELAEHAQGLLRKVVKAQGFNIGLNLGKCAGAGVADHLHLHIVPRWEGDHNFMPTLGGKRMLFEAVEAIYRRLLAAQNGTSKHRRSLAKS